MVAAEIILIAIGAYLTVGLLFGVWYVSRAITSVDLAAQGAPFLIRLLFLPGVAALWPLMGLRWWRMTRASP